MKCARRRISYPYDLTIASFVTCFQEIAALSVVVEPMMGILSWGKGRLVCICIQSLIMCYLTIPLSTILYYILLGSPSTCLVKQEIHSRQ